VSPPFDAGFESVGVVVAAGSAVPASLQPGAAVAATGYGAFSEYQIVKARAALPLPSASAHFLPLLVSGLTASVALNTTGEMKTVGVNGARQETVLVTAAAGGTGLFAVQLAKAAGHHVIATCSSDDKVAVLRSLGVDRVINYKKEEFGSVLRKEYPRGIDIVYESVGGEMFLECVKNLAVKGRLIVIGFISGYEDGSAWKGVAKNGAAASSGAAVKATKKPPPPLPALLLGKSASIRGFFLNDYADQFKSHMAHLSQSVANGSLQSIVDPTRFVGLEQVPLALDRMYAGKNVGKVVVDLAPDQHAQGEKAAPTPLASKL